MCRTRLIWKGRLPRLTGAWTLAHLTLAAAAPRATHPSPLATPLLPHTPSTHPSPLRHHSAWRRLRTGEEPRSIVQTRTIERRVLGDIGGQTIEFVGRLEAIQQDLRSIGTREVLVQVRGLRRRQGGHAAPAVPLR